MSGGRGLLTLSLASAMLIASGLGLEDLRLFGDAETAEEPSDLNLGDCLRKTDRSQWPPAYAAICDDLLAAISAAPGDAEGRVSAQRRQATKAAVPKEPSAKHVVRKDIAPMSPGPKSTELMVAPQPAPRPISRPKGQEIAQPARPVEPPPCVIGAAGKVTIGRGKSARVSAAQLVSSSAAGRAPAGVALAVPATCLLESPAAGKVVFAGAFKGYSGVVIVELPQGRRLVIAGLGSLQVRRGARVARGDILGASSDGRVPALEAAFGGGKASVVYFDMRNRSGKPEAVPWFATAS